MIAQAMDRFNAQGVAWCQMGNHYHLVLHTREANLSRLMRHINGVYTQSFNRRHGLVGHLFQGRFKAILVDREAYLLALCRYVERNPVAAGVVAAPGDWAWSSYRAHTGQADAPDWLDVDGLHGQLLGAPVVGDAMRRRAQAQYADLVCGSKESDATFWTDALAGQIYLGDQAFVERMQAKVGGHKLAQPTIPKRQRKRPVTWQGCLAKCHGDTASALHMAYREGGMTMTALAQEAGISVTHVSRLIAGRESLSAAR